VEVGELSQLSRKLTKDASGIWTPTDGVRERVSFPDYGHGECFAMEDDSFWFQHRNECIYRALVRHPFEGPIVDIGGGNGAVACDLVRRGIPTILVEPAPDGAHNAKRRGLRDVVCATLDQAAFEPNSFGAAGLFDVIEHVKEDIRLLRSVHHVLRPGGIVCITVPAHTWLWSANDHHAGHLRRYTERSLFAALSEASFTVRYSTYFFAPLVLPLFLLRSLRHRLRPRTLESMKEAANDEHSPSPHVRRVMDALLAPEGRRIGLGRRIPVGTSCLVVAVAR
jgi:SAM-dependent methyltransferase